MRKSFLLLVLVLCGCTSVQPKSDLSISSTVSSWIEQTAAVQIEEVYSGDKEIYLKIRTFLKDSNYERVVYGRVRWHDEDINLQLSKNLVIPMELVDQASWQIKSSDLTSVKILPEHHWQNFQMELAHDITPKQPNTGIVIRRDEKELVFYYNNQNQLIICDVKEKPKKIKIQESLSQQRLSEKILILLKKYLALHEEGAQKIIMATSGENDYSGPFLFVDFTNALVLGLKIDSNQHEGYEQSIFQKGLKTADYLVLDSFVLGTLTRPVSSSARVLQWSRNTAYDVISPKKFTMLLNEPIPSLYDGEPMDLEKWENKLNRIIGKNLTSGQMNFLIGGDQFFPKLIEAIIAAKESIYFRIFIFDNDDYAVEIADLLKKKSNEGVKIQVLLDAMGQVMGEGKVAESLPAGFVPPTSMEQYLREDSNIEVRVRPNAWFKADHTKTITIDEQVTFTGGMNIGREYRYDWHDLMMELRGPINAQILNEFNLAWEHAGTLGDLAYLKRMLSAKRIKQSGQGYPIRPLYTRANDSQIYKAQLAAIGEAKKYIYISNAYFSDNNVLYELIKARRRGVDVRVILPVNGNHEIMNKSNIVTANVMFENGIRVYFYPGMSHIKAAVYDGWLCTGSANFDKLSFKDNLEFNLATSYPEAVEQILEELFYPDFKRSMEMTEPIEHGLKERIAEFLAEQL